MVTAHECERVKRKSWSREREKGERERMSEVLGNYRVGNTRLINMRSMQIGWLAFFLSRIRRQEKQRRLSTIILPMERRICKHGGWGGGVGRGGGEGGWLQREGA